MLVGARIGVPRWSRVDGHAADPVLRVDRLAARGDPFRKITFLIGLGMIMVRARSSASARSERAGDVARARRSDRTGSPWKRISTAARRVDRAWARGRVGRPSLLHQPGVLWCSRSTGAGASRWSTASRWAISDSTPISAAFVTSAS
jgi:predicted RNA polymerase sigma factor